LVELEIFAIPTDAPGREPVAAGIFRAERPFTAPIMRDIQRSPAGIIADAKSPLLNNQLASKSSVTRAADEPNVRNVQKPNKMAAENSCRNFTSKATPSIG
jgi:hypothetical protein